MALNIIDFINARLDEDEKAAKAATPSPWNLRLHEADDKIMTESGDALIDAKSYEEVVIEVSDEDLSHISRHDPARVLREVAAKREVLDVCKHVHGHVSGNETADNLAESVLMSLANAWSTHADFKPEWAL